MSGAILSDASGMSSCLSGIAQVSLCPWDDANLSPICDVSSVNLAYTDFGKLITNVVDGQHNSINGTASGISQEAYLQVYELCPVYPRWMQKVSVSSIARNKSLIERLTQIIKKCQIRVKSFR